METWKIILGLITAAILIVIKDAHSKAHKQKVVSTRLHTYLIYWRKIILENDFLGIFYVKGVAWNQELISLMQNGASATDLLKLNEDKKSELIKIKESLLSQDELFSSNEIKTLQGKLSDGEAERFINTAKLSTQNLIDGKTFISDDDASNLSSAIAQLTIEIKMNLISLTNSSVSLLTHMASEKKPFDHKNHIDEIVKMIWLGITTSKNIDLLLRKTEKISSDSVIKLTVKNILNLL